MLARLRRVPGLHHGAQHEPPHKVLLRRAVGLYQNVPETRRRRRFAPLEGQEIDLGEYLRLGRGEERCGGRTRPSVVSDAFEALIAALYLDGGMDVARSFILPFITEGKHAEADYKTRLQEIVQQNPEERLSYVVEQESGPDHDKHFVVAVRFNSDKVARGEGRSKKMAEQHAAREALKLLGVIKEK